jgi:hypothetical protein
LNPRRNAADFPEYRSSMNSTSVRMSARRHNFAKKKTVSTVPATIFHQNQLPAMPFFATSSVTASGVSAAKVVATIVVPASHQGIFLPDRKKSSVLPPARFLRMRAIAILTIK